MRSARKKRKKLKEPIRNEDKEKREKKDIYY